ncbi:uncharacterized protein LOC124285934 [Haliotis rubra]|uniref:uncharacterized protein LOC124285934 n=1 Tax=Haliotis rubra TaxID=36100 RepID=UPI001EE50A8D|nr:uncharacterized protein LOC124285934 [Haliotis rubra]XP_046578171.1 uncharacterized protein LOC124285934 [Haliotis rubra]XP_046578172.1 uncharacterized protein LOC124285934 [Haliotis rubra]XP_046578173.1 uncharacterized protein LOC124285934 [Haliotis rubra]XP_046578174.1 uncharacterized protein LOC124285934 [Haliotis rubra]
MKRCLRLILIATVILSVFRLLYILFVLPEYGETRLHPGQLWSKRYLPSLGHQINVSPQQIDLRVIVLAYDRAESLTRCLASLKEAEYNGDRVHIDVWIDCSKSGQIDGDTYTAAMLFSFKYGTVTVHNHTRHVGIYGQWLGTWKVTEQTKEIALFLEDDVTVSKYFYKWLKAVHTKYDSVANINGYSTQGMSMKHSGDRGWLQAPKSEVVFSYPVLGTWGFSPSLKNWLGFLNWYRETASNPSFHPLVPGLKPSNWYRSFMKSGKTDSMWSMWHIYYANKNNELTIYPNLPFRQGLTTNGNEKGLHYSTKQKTQAGRALVEWLDKYIALPSVPVQLDTHGRVVRS